MSAKPATLFIRACSAGKKDAAGELLRDGVSPDTLDGYGLTGLIWAARKGHVEVARLLLGAGADINATDRVGRTALTHAVVFNQYAFVQFIAAEGASVNTTDAHGWTALDHACLPENQKMIALLEQFGARVRSGRQVPRQKEKGSNTFYLSIGVGGPDFPVEVERIHMQLGSAIHMWSGDYTGAIRTFGFAGFADGSLIRYSKTMSIVGAQKAKRKRDWLEVRIGIPESWWRESEAAYKKRLADAIEEGLHSMVALLKRNRHEIKAEALFADWEKVKKSFLDTPAPSYPAEQQRARLNSLVQETKRSLERGNKPGTA